MKLDLGSGPRPADGFLGVDKLPITDFQVDFDLGEPWPFADASVDELRSSHCIEHIANGYRPKWVKVPVHVGLVEDAKKVPWRFRVHDRTVWEMTTVTKDLLFHFFDEAYRIIKPGGTFEVHWPNPQSRNASGDPTHRRLISETFIVYLNRAARKTLGVDFYDVECNWVGAVDALPVDEYRELPDAELRDKMRREYNACDELRMVLRADK